MPPRHRLEGRPLGFLLQCLKYHAVVGSAGKVFEPRVDGDHGRVEGPHVHLVALGRVHLALIGPELGRLVVASAADCRSQRVVVGESKVGELELVATVARQYRVENIIGLHVPVDQFFACQVIKGAEHLA